jgi:hypothetical protein
VALTDSLISYWELEAASGTRVDAVTATGNDLTDNNTVGQAAGIVGNAAVFVTANQEYLSRASNASLQTGDIDFSFVSWVKLQTGNNQHFAGKNGLTTGEYDFYYSSGDSRFGFNIFDSGYGVPGNVLANTFGAPSGDVWYFVFCAHDSVNNKVMISVNAGTIDESATTGTITAANDAFEMGARTASSDYNSSHSDQVGFWKRVLTPAEVTQLYNGGAGMSYAAISASSLKVGSLFALFQ